MFAMCRTEKKVVCQIFWLQKMNMHTKPLPGSFVLHMSVCPLFLHPLLPMCCGSRNRPGTNRPGSSNTFRDPTGSTRAGPCGPPVRTPLCIEVPCVRCHQHQQTAADRTRRAMHDGTSGGNVYQTKANLHLQWF